MEHSRMPGGLFSLESYSAPFVPATGVVMVNWKQDMVLAVILVGWSMGFYAAGLTYNDSSSVFPSYLSRMLMVLGACLAVSAYRRREPAQSLVSWQFARGPILVVLLTAGFILILPYIGFIPSSFLLASAIFLSLGYPNKVVALAVALIAAVAIYLIFHTALDVPLPMGTLWTGE
jgi:hypothetical protein